MARRFSSAPHDCRKDGISTVGWKTMSEEKVEHGSARDSPSGPYGIGEGSRQDCEKWSRNIVESIS